jgi:heptosyltransferase I
MRPPVLATAKQDAVLQFLRKSERGLLVQLAGLGDLIMALPAINSLQAALPRLQWTLLTRSVAADLMGDRMERVVSIPWPPRPSTVVAILQGLLRLRRRRFDIAIHFYGISTARGAVAMKALFLTINPRLSIGRTSSDRWSLFDISWDERCSPSQHEVDLNLALVQSLGIPIIEHEPALSPKSVSEARMASLLGPLWSRENFVVIFPGGAKPTKQWPLENYEALAARISALGLGIYVIGSQADQAAAQAIVAAAGAKGVNLAGRLPIQDVATVLSKALGYIGNDSGPTHLAAALGIPCVALFGPTDASRFRPRGLGPIRVLQQKGECSPCELTTGGHHTCMRSLTLESVFMNTLELIGEPPSR